MDLLACAEVISIGGESCIGADGGCRGVQKPHEKNGRKEGRSSVSFQTKPNHRGKKQKAYTTLFLVPPTSGWFHTCPSVRPSLSIQRLKTPLESWLPITIGNGSVREGPNRTCLKPNRLQFFKPEPNRISKPLNRTAKKSFKPLSH